jgi:hypothetical protein
MSAALQYQGLCVNKVTGIGSNVRDPRFAYRYPWSFPETVLTVSDYG